MRSRDDDAHASRERDHPIEIQPSARAPLDSIDLATPRRRDAKTLRPATVPVRARVYSNGNAGAGHAPCPLDLSLPPCTRILTRRAVAVWPTVAA